MGRCACERDGSGVREDGCTHCRARMNRECVGHRAELRRLDPPGRAREKTFVPGMEKEFPGGVTPAPGDSLTYYAVYRRG